MISLVQQRKELNRKEFTMIGKILKGIGIVGVVYVGIFIYGAIVTKYLNDHGLNTCSMDQEYEMYENTDCHRQRGGL